METENLWPSFEDLPSEKSPTFFLKEQGNYLSKTTKNLLKVDVITNRNPSEIHRFYTEFHIVAPMLDNYDYELFYIDHDIFNYPCDVTFGDKKYKAIDEQELLAHMKEIFNSPKTKKLIISLLNQSKEKDNPFSY